MNKNKNNDNFNDLPFFYWEDVILWLSQFMDKYSFFSDGEWLSYHEELDSWDVNRIKNFKLFFDKIKNYASDNYIFPYKDKDIESYFVLWNDIFYEVSKRKKHYCCKRMKEGSQFNYYIDFDHVISGKKQKRALNIDNKLQILSDLVKVCSIEGIPSYAIYDAVDKGICRSNEEENTDIKCYHKIKKKNYEE